MDEVHAGFFDRRKYVRAKVKFRVVFQMVDGLVRGEEKRELSEQKHEFEGETENLSAGGIVFVTFEAFKIGDVLELKMELPDMERTRIQCLGRVVRVVPLGDANAGGDRFSFRVAISFLAISSSDRRSLENYCKDASTDEKV